MYPKQIKLTSPPLLIRLYLLSICDVAVIILILQSLIEALSKNWIDVTWISHPLDFLASY